MAAKTTIIRRHLRFTRFLAVVGTSGLLLLDSAPSHAQNPCHSGAVPMANAYVRANYLYALVYGSLESYVTQNSSHFVRNGDAIQCARAVSSALMRGSIQSYDPNDLRRQQELNARLGAMGISPGPTQLSASAQMYGMSQQLLWLADVLPPAAHGNYTPLRTPATQEQQMRLFAAQLLHSMLQDPTMRQAILAQEALIREGANIEYRMLLVWANQVTQ